MTDEALTDEFRIRVPDPDAGAIQVCRPGGQLVVRINYDGSVDFGPGVTPDAAAREFYRVLAEQLEAGRPK